MASRCEKELDKEKRKACIVIRTDNECSTDEQVIHCCSIKGIKELLPVLNRNNNNNNDNNINKKYYENILKSKEHLDNYMQIYHCKTEQDLLNKKDLIKQDERMYDLAHLLFKISDLSLKVTEYEKINCVKETDLRKMLNIVKVEIMKSFFKGKTKHETMNKIILRLMYLDEIIKEMYESKVDCNTKIINQNTIKKNIDKKQCMQNNKKQSINNNERTTIKTINPKETIYTDNNSIDEITIAPTSSNLTAPFNGFVPHNTLREIKNYSLSGKKEIYSFKNDHESVISNKNLKLSQNLSVKSSKSCYMTHNKSDYDKQTLNNKTIKKSIRKDRKQSLKLIDESVQTDFDKLSTIERYSAATSYEDIYINPNRSMPNIGANQLWKQRHIPKLNPKDWVEIDGHMEMIEIPVDKLNKQISAQKLTKIDDTISENVENNAQTDDILLTENGDYQIVSMTILYSKTHARYIIPNWKPVDYNIDEMPKVLSKQDLDDGMALTSYKADQDGTIHFTLTFANNQLSNLVNNGDGATKNLVKQLKEIRGLWAESARILYNTLVKEYDEQNIKVEFTNYDTESNENKNDKVEENPNLESSFVSSNPYSNY